MDDSLKKKTAQNDDQNESPPLAVESAPGLPTVEVSCSETRINSTR